MKYITQLTWIAAILSLAVLAFLNPVYRYDTIKVRQSEFPVRINRYTGDAYVLSETGWMHHTIPAIPNVQRLPDSVAHHIVSSAKFMNLYRSLQIQIHNNSPYWITQMRVRTPVGDSLHARDFDVWASTGSIRPYSSGLLSANTQGTYETMSHDEYDFSDVLSWEPKTLAVFGFK